MSGTDYVGRLLDGVAVDWKALRDVAKYSGARIDSSEVNKENYVGVDNLLPNRAGKIDSSYVPTEGRLIHYRAGDILVGNIRPYLKKIWLANQAGGTNGDVLVVRPTHPSLNSGYLYQVLANEEFFTYSMQHARGAKMPRGDKTKILEYSVPIPCPDNPDKSLAIQAEIVRILNTFTALTGELTAELTARKKQYNYYRDQLLRFEDGEVEWKTLEDLAENLDSKRKPITSSDREFGDIPYYGASGIVDYVKDYIFDEDLLLVSEDGANLVARNTPIAFSISGKSWVNNHSHVLRFESYAERRYVELFLNSIDLAPYISGAAQPKLNKSSLESIRVPSPTPEEKERIVAILDKFDALTNSITQGLPREIGLRKKQYAYYRDLLLSFRRSEEMAG